MTSTRAARDPRLLVAFALYAPVLLEGIMLSSIGPSLDVLADQSGSTLSRISILFTANSLGYITGSLLGGRLYERRDGTGILAVALASMAVLTALIPVAGSLGLLVVLFAIIGISIGLVDVGGNTLLVWLFGSEVPPYMNTLHLGFGIGAFLSPLIIDRFAVITGNAANAFYLFAILMVPVAVWVYRTPSPHPPETIGTERSFDVIRRHTVWLGAIAVLFFMHVGAELSFGGWIFSYADELGVGAETTSRVLNSMFWGGLVLGRLIAIPLSRRLSPTSMLQLDLAGALVSLGLLAFAADWPASVWIGTVGFGMSVASMFATCINYAGERITITSHVTALFLIGGSAGSMSMPWLVGQLFESRGPEWMVYIVGAASVAAVVLFAGIRATAPPARPQLTTSEGLSH